MRILAIVVTYYPDEDVLKKNVSAFIHEVDKVLIWENTANTERAKYRFVNNSKVEYLGADKNSISRALNYAWHYAMDYGYEYLLTMDQDSVFVDFSQYLKLTVFNSKCPEGIWTPSFIGVDAHLSFEKKNYKVIQVGMTSGMLQSISVITKIGGWNEAFSIDGVDSDYCLHAHRLGIKTYSIGCSIMAHRFGSPQKVSFLGRQATLLHYSARRYYSIYRSHVLLTRTYKEQTDYKPLSFWYPEIKWIACLEEHGLKKLIYILAGIVSGYLCKLPKR